MLDSLIKPQALLFDLDGTVVDTAADFTTAIDQLYDEIGQPRPPLATYRSYINLGVFKLAQQLFPQKADDTVLMELYRQKILHNYRVANGRSAKLFTGAKKLINLLQSRNTAWGIVTNKPREFAEPLLQKLRVNAPELITPSEVENAKPDPEGIVKICHRLQISCDKNVYYLGDSPLDMIAAKRAGVTAIRANYGYLQPNQQWVHDLEIDSLLQLHDALVESLC